jgi:twinkle protein
MSAYQMLKQAYPTAEPNVVSLPNGANTKAIEDNYEFLNGYDEIVVCTDSDEPGQKVAEEIVKALAWARSRWSTCLTRMPTRCCSRIRAVYLSSISSRPRSMCQTGSGVVWMWSLTHLQDQRKGFELPYPLLNQKLHGLRKGELTTITAGSGIGKSTIAREIVYHMLDHHGLKMGLIFLEEPSSKPCYLNVAMDINIPVARIREDHTTVNKDKAKVSFDRLVHNDNFWFIDHFGSIKADSLLEKMRYLAVVKKCDFIVLDHLSMVISGLATTDERKDIDILMTKLAAFVNETGVGILNVVHLKRTGGVSFNHGGAVSLNDLRGSAALEQLSWNVLALERDQQDEENPNISQIRVLKNREWGYTGLCDTCEYNVLTGRHRSIIMGD